MKNLTKILLILLFVAVVNQSNAQVTFGLRIGANFSKQKIDFDGVNIVDTENMKMLPGANLGFILDIPISDPFSIETGLMLNTRGYKIKETGVDYKYVAYNYLAYIDLPVNAKYTFDLGGPKFFVLAGPYFAFGIFGKGGAVETAGSVRQTSEWDYEWGGEDLNNHKRLDIGMNIGGGFQFGSFVIGATYGIGLKNIATIDGLTTKNKLLAVSIGVNFGN